MQLVNMPLDGVPRLGVVSIGDVSVLLVSVLVDEMVGITTPSTANTPAALLESVVSLALPSSKVVATKVAPETCVVNTPDAKLAVVPVVVVPVSEVKVPVEAITVAPETCVVNTPDAKLAVVPVVVVPERFVKLPVGAVIMAPEIVPVAVTLPVKVGF